VPVSAELVGSLVTEGPTGLLPFDRAHAPAEWRALRLRAKAAVLGRNTARALQAPDARPRQVILVGGPAGDDKAVGAVTAVLPGNSAIGRGDVAGLGHRYAVAYGLIRHYAASRS
jgi:Diol dehydratase reactivase ATPase-like domain